MAASFVVDLSPPEKENESPDGCSLQDAFLKFKNRRKNEIARDLQSYRRQRADPAMMEELRRKFVDQVKSYIGVPYARRYHEPSSPTHHSKLFLDCCGLVRRALKDLREEFGFHIGPGNQAYQFDTLPVTLEKDQMKPGDLVFISGTYFDSKKKAQKHDMVHVEVWLGEGQGEGEGEATVGARWQRGRVEIHPSYRFSSTSYHSMVYHFRSIDTWLLGQCQSHCPEHSWKPRMSFVPGKKSVFYPSQDQEGADSEDGGQEDHVTSCDRSTEHHESHVTSCDHSTGQQESHVTSCDHPMEKHPVLQENRRVMPCDVSPDHQDSENRPVLSPEVSGSVSLGPSSPLPRPSPGQAKGVVGPGLGQGKQTKKTARAKPDQLKPARPATTKFYIGGKNGGCLVEEALLLKGWERIHDNVTSRFYMKWVELKSQINYSTFREGEQLVNHFPSFAALSTKTGLMESMADLQRSQARSAANRSCPDVRSFYPQTLRLDNPQQREQFRAVFKDGGRWICKPSSLNQGKGIFLVESVEQVEAVLDKDSAQASASKRPCSRVVQRYLEHPLLIDGRKFDIRAYLLVVGGGTYVLLYHHGYLRLTCAAYDPTSRDLAVHLTNQYVQRQQSSYQQLKEDTVWSYSQLQEYLCRHHEGELGERWVDSTMKASMQSIMKACFSSMKHKLENKLGYFDLLGFDFMVDSQFKVWLIEVNVNPALYTTCAVLQSLIPALIGSTLDVTLDVFESLKRGKPLPDLTKYGSFEVLQK